MSVADTLRQALAQGVYLYLEDGRLKFRAAPGALSDALKEKLSADKEAIIAHLLRIEGQSGTRTAKLPDLRRSAGQGRQPLSHSQQRLWFIDRLDQGAVQYNLPSAFTVRGHFDKVHFAAAIRLVVQRHEVLRACFLEDQGKPYLIVRDDPPLTLHDYDFRAFAEPQRQEKLRQLIADDACTPFRLDRDVLLRTSLAQLGDEEHVIVFNMHHIVSDAWSLGILIGELSQIYAALESGRSPSLPPLRYQYGDYARWQPEWLRGELLSGQLDYWKRRLAGAPALHALPLSHARPERQCFDAKMVRVTASAALTQALHALCLRYDVTLFMLLQTAFAVLLGRYSGERDVVIGTPVAGRIHEDLEPLIGFFVNILVLRTDLGGAPSFARLLAASKADILQAYDNQYVSFDMLVEELKPVRSLAHSPIFQVMLVMQQKGNRHLSLGSLHLELVEKSSLRTPYDLELAVLEESQLQFSWKYNDSLFDAAAMQAMATNFLVLLDSIVADPERCIDALDLIGPEERAWLDDCGRGETIAVAPIPLHELIRAQALQSPQRAALHCAGTTLTAQQLEVEANRLARRLGEEGVRPGDIVALCLQRSADIPVCLLAVLKAGAAFLPVDPNHPPQRVSYVLEDAAVKLVLTQTRLSPLFVDSGARALYVDGDNFRASLLRHDGEHPPSSSLPLPMSALAYVIYTSGSTGKPKGVLVEHAQLSSFHAAMQRVIHTGQPHRVWLAVTNYCFDIAILELLCTLAFGFTVVLSEDRHVAAGGAADDATDASLAELIRHHQVTHLQSTPSLLTMYLRNPAFAQQLGRIEQLLIGGEALPPSLLEELAARTGARLVNMYGPTETTIWSTCQMLEAGQTQVGIGRPIANTRVHVLDEALQPVPKGAAGELCIGGAGVSRGYLNRTALTAEKFVEPASVGARVYRTGDKVRWQSDGQLAFLGRFDYQVKLRGFRIELGEIESVLAGHETVAAAAVVARAVGSETQLVAYLVPASGVVPSDAQRQAQVRRLKSDLGAVLPDYMVPAIIVFLAQLPLTSNGKVDRNALPAPGDADRQRQSYVAPRNELEQAVCVLWQELLGVERVGIEDNFFELGGHSLLSTQLTSRMRESLGMEVGISVLFEHPTLAGFAAAALNRQTNALLPAIEPVRDRENLPLSFAQQRLWVIDRLEGQSAQYNMPYGFTLRGGIDKTVIERTLTTIVQRHESLRTRFYEVDGEVCQHVDRDFRFRLVQRDLSDLDAAAQRAEVKRISIEDEKTPFNLGRDLMLRAQLLILSREEHVLLFNMHHIVSDGWSMKLLVMEFYRIYTAYLHGRENPLPPLALQYGDYSSWQRGWLKGEVLEQQIRYWRERLEGIPRVHHVPLDKPRPRRQTFNGDSVGGFLDIRQLNRAKLLCQHYGVTLFMLLQTVFAIVLARYSSQRDIVLGTVVAGRGHKDVEPIIGFFLNTLVLRTTLEDSATFEQLLLRNKRHIVDAYSYQHVPFDMLVDQLKPPRSSRYNPVFQIMISLLDDKNEGMALSQADLQLEIIKRKKSTAKFELVLNLVESAKGLKISLVYNTDLFFAATAQGMLDLLTRLIGDVLDTPTAPLPMLPRGAAIAAPRGVPIAAGGGDGLDAYRRRLATEPQAAAVFECRDGQPARSLSFAELDAAAERLCQRLDALDAGPVVAVLLSADAAAVAACLAVLRAGRSLLVLAPAQGDGLIDHAIDRSRADVVVGAGAAMARLAQRHAGSALRLLDLQDSSTNADDEHRAAVVPPSASGAEDTVLLVYAPGCGLDVRCTRISRSAVAGSAAVWATRTPGVLLSLLPRDVQSLLQGWIYPLLGGHAVVLAPRTAEVAAADGLPVSSLMLTTAELPQLARYASVDGVAPAAIYLSGSGIAPLQLEQAMAVLPATALHTVTDIATPLAATLMCAWEPASSTTETPLQMRTVGLDWRVLGDAGGEAPVDCFGSLQVARDAPADADGYHDTDLRARWRSGGGLEIAGPRQCQIGAAEGWLNLAALRQQIEAVAGVQLALLGPAVADAPVERVICYVLAEAAEALPGSATAARVAGVLADIAQDTGVSMELLLGDSLMLSPDGRLDLAQLPSASVDTQRQAGSSPPQTDTQRQLLHMWQKVLGERPIGRGDNFFAVGGHSLLMILLIKKIAETFAVDIPMATFMDSATIEELGYLIDYALAQQRAPADQDNAGNGDMEEFLL